MFVTYVPGLLLLTGQFARRYQEDASILYYLEFRA